jgi:hypothetical protein
MKRLQKSQIAVFYDKPLLLSLFASLNTPPATTAKYILWMLGRRILDKCVCAYEKFTLQMAVDLFE